MKIAKNLEKVRENSKVKVNDDEVEEAFRKIIRWIGEDPSREGLIETPKRVVKHSKNILKDTIKMQIQN